MAALEIHCPNCSHSGAERAKRRWFERNLLTRLFRLYPFWCLTCRQRFYLRLTPEASRLERAARAA